MSKASFTFTAKPEQLPAVQRVVKAHGFRFEGNPASGMHLPSLRVTVSYEGDDSEGWQRAVAAINAVITPPEPPAVPRDGWFKRIWSK